MLFRCCREGDGENPLLSAPSRQEKGVGLSRATSYTGRPITKMRRWWQYAVSPGTFSISLYAGLPQRCPSPALPGKPIRKVQAKVAFVRHLLVLVRGVTLLLRKECEVYL